MASWRLPQPQPFLLMPRRAKNRASRSPRNEPAWQVQEMLHFFGLTHVVSMPHSLRAHCHLYQPAAFGSPTFTNRQFTLPPRQTLQV